MGGQRGDRTPNPKPCSNVSPSARGKGGEGLRQRGARPDGPCDRLQVGLRDRRCSGGDFGCAVPLTDVLQPWHPAKTVSSGPAGGSFYPCARFQPVSNASALGTTGSHAKVWGCHLLLPSKQNKTKQKTHFLEKHTAIRLLLR